MKLIVADIAEIEYNKGQFSRPYMSKVRWPQKAFSAIASKTTRQNSENYFPFINKGKNCIQRELSVRRRAGFRASAARPWDLGERGSRG